MVTKAERGKATTILGLWLVAFFFAPFLTALVLLGSAWGLAKQEQEQEQEQEPVRP